MDRKGVIAGSSGELHATIKDDECVLCLLNEDGVFTEATFSWMQLVELLQLLFPEFLRWLKNRV